MGFLDDLRYIFSPLVGSQDSSKGDKLEIGERKDEKRGRVYLSEGDRETHLYVIGSSGIGKSKFLEYIASQDIERDQGLGVIDLHGDLFESLVNWACYIMLKIDAENTSSSDYSKKAKDFLKKVVIIDPCYQDYIVGFNPLEVSGRDDPYPYVLELITVFKKLWEDAWGQRMEDILRNTLLALCEKGLTMLEIPRFLTDKDFRSYLLQDLVNEEVKEYWKRRFDSLNPKTKAEWIESTLNKVSTFISDPYIRDIIGQRRSTINLREIMDNGKILLINLAKGRLKENSNLLGALLVSKIQQAAISRVDITKEERRRFYLYIDEFQNFATKSFEEVLSEARKYGLSIIMANQNLAQLDFDLKASVIQNARVQIYFGMGRKDAEDLAKEVFLVTGKNIKYQLFKEKEIFLRSEPKSNPVYEGIQEEWENHMTKLVRLKPRYCYVHIRGKGTVFMRTLDTPDSAKNLGWPKQDFEKVVQDFKKSAILNHARMRYGVRREIKERRENLEAEYELSRREPRVYHSRPILLSQ